MTAIAWLDLAIDIIWTAVCVAGFLLATFGCRELRFIDRVGRETEHARAEARELGWLK